MTAEKEIDVETSVIEVFKTDVRNVYQASQIQERIEEVFPHFCINFDLDDCDRILRIKSPIAINPADIILIGKEFHVDMEVLAD